MMQRLIILILVSLMLMLSSCGGSSSGGGKENASSQQKIVFTGASTIARGNWSAYFGIPITNAAEEGIESTDLKNRIEGQVASKPDKIFFSIGTNDILNRHEAFLIGNISSIIDKIRASSPATKIYIISMLPVKDASARALIERYNDQIPSVCNGGKATYIFIYNLFKNAADINENYYQEDGLHLTPEGYQVYGDAIRFYVLL